MNSAEYQSFLADFRARFPDDSSWLHQHPDTVALWYNETFSKLPAEDCAQASQRLSTGLDEVWKAYERSSIPAAYRAICGKLSQSRTKQAEARAHRERESSRGLMHESPEGPKLLEAIKQLGAMRQSGMSEQERRSWLDTYFAESPDKSRRYRCLQCNDLGWVQVLRPEIVAAASAGKEPKQWRTCLALCDCSSSDRLPQEFRAGPQQGTRIPQFGDQAWHIAARDPDAKAKAATYVHKPEGYNDAFEQFDPQFEVNT